MMVNKLMIFQLLLMVVIASQGIFYLLGAAEAFRHLSIQAFAEQRTVLDLIIAGRLKLIYCLALVTGLVILVLLRKTPSSITFIGIAVATLFLLADLMLALTVSMPINKDFATLPIADLAQGARLQITWLNAMVYRGVLAAAALVSLFVACTYK